MDQIGMNHDVLWSEASRHSKDDSSTDTCMHAYTHADGKEGLTRSSNGGSSNSYLCRWCQSLKETMRVILTERNQEPSL